MNTTKKYELNLFNDGSEIEIMTKEELLNFAEEQVCEWYEEIMLNINHDESLKEKHEEALKIVDKVINNNYKIKTIKEVEKLFKLPAITIPFKAIK